MLRPRLTCVGPPQAETDDVQTQLYQTKQDQQAVAIELRMAEAQLEQVRAASDAAALQLAHLEKELAAQTQAAQEAHPTRRPAER